MNGWRWFDVIEISVYIAVALFVTWMFLWEPIQRAWRNYFWREIDGRFVRKKNKFFKRRS